MLYRITLDLAFEQLDPTGDIFDKALDALDKAKVIQPHQIDEERGYIKLAKCYHDEDPNRPCDILAEHKVPYED